MARDITSAVNTAFNSNNFNIAILVKSVWNSGTTYAWSGAGDLSWDGQTWTGVGYLGGVSPIEETSETKAVGASFSLSGIPSSLLSLVLGQARQGNEISMWVAVINEDGSVVADPHKIFSGLMDVPSIKEDGDSCTLKITAENRLIELDRAAKVRYTDQYQKDRHSGDLFFEYVAGLQDKPIRWGLKSLNSGDRDAAIAAAGLKVNDITRSIFKG